MEAVDKLADAHGISSSQFSIAWCLQVPGVTCPIIGPRTLDQLTSVLKVPDVKLSAETMSALDRIWPGPGGEAPKAYAW